MTSPSPSRIHGHWLLLTIWLALLVALVYSAAHGLPLAYSSTSDTLELLINVSAQILNRPFEDFFLYAPIALVIGVAIPAVFMLMAWLKFIDLTRDLFVSFAEIELGEPVSFSRLLVFRPDAPDEVEPDSAENSIVGEVLRPLAFAWAIILLLPPMVGAGLLLLLDR